MFGLTAAKHVDAPIAMGADGNSLLGSIYKSFSLVAITHEGGGGEWGEGGAGVREQIRQRWRQGEQAQGGRSMQT